MTPFAAIRERAEQRKGGAETLARILGPARSNAVIADVSDDRILSTMAERIFSAGFVWRVIEQKWPGFEEAFLGFQPKALLFQPDEFWEDLAKDERIVRNPQKIRAVRDNAAFVARVSDNHGSFGKHVSEWPADDQVGLMAWLSKNGTRLGGNTGQYFLRWIGWDGFILSGDFVVCLRDAGLEIAQNPSSKKDLAAIQAQINAWAEETGLCRTHIARICALSVGENHDAETIIERARGD